MSMDSYKYDRYTASRQETRWATVSEIQESKSTVKLDISRGLYPGAGLPVLSDGTTIYADNSDTHSLIFGATGSKKTRLFCMPMLKMFAMAGESFIATDPKGELYDKTSGLVRAQGYKTVVLNFRDLELSDFWNPLKIPYELYHSGQTEAAISLLDDLVQALSAPQRESSKDIYWPLLGASLALAHLLFFIETAKADEANIFNFAQFCVTQASPEEVKELCDLTYPGSIAATNYKGILSNAEAKATFGNVVSVVANMVNPFITRRNLCQVLSESSFDIRNVGREKTAIYIIVPDEKTTLHFLVTTFIKQIYEILIGEAQKEARGILPVRVNFMLDEFCNIPTVPDMPAMISAARSRNMRFFLAVQGIHQLRDKYGNSADTIKGNCDNWVFLTSKEYDLLREITQLCGSVTYIERTGGMATRPLISISELQRLNKERGEALIMHGRHYPLITELADIDAYTFPHHERVELIRRELPEIVYYDLDEIKEDIRSERVPVPFSREVEGYERFFSHLPKRDYSDYFDW